MSKLIEEFYDVVDLMVNKEEELVIKSKPLVFNKNHSSADNEFYSINDLISNSFDCCCPVSYKDKTGFFTVRVVDFIFKDEDTSCDAAAFYGDTGSAIVEIKSHDEEEVLLRFENVYHGTSWDDNQYSFSDLVLTKENMKIVTKTIVQKVIDVVEYI